MRYYATVGGRTVEVELGGDGVSVDGRPVEVDLRRVAGTRVRSLLVDGDSHRVVAHRDEGGAWEIHLRGRRVPVEVVDERTRAIREMTGGAGGPAGPKALRAPMPGLVVKVEVEVGEVVEPGRGVVIVEAMKMENELAAEAPGRVEAIRVEEGEAVEKNQVLVEFAPLDDEGGP